MKKIFFSMTLLGLVVTQSHAFMPVRMTNDSWARPKCCFYPGEGAGNAPHGLLCPCSLSGGMKPPESAEELAELTKKYDEKIKVQCPDGSAMPLYYVGVPSYKDLTENIIRSCEIKKLYSDEVSKGNGDDDIRLKIGGIQWGSVDDNGYCVTSGGSMQCEGGAQGGTANCSWYLFGSCYYYPNRQTPGIVKPEAFKK